MKGLAAFAPFFSAFSRSSDGNNIRPGSRIRFRRPLRPTSGFSAKFAIIRQLFDRLKIKSIGSSL